ncbi:MAG: response regulator transcription factor [Ignavibacteriales bacterium]|nr:response regulator transcription factor [Ignavibacteriales bacterium]
MRIEVSIVEDSDQLRESLAVLINGYDKFKCISTFDNAEAALRNLPKQKPHVVLMDINLPHMNGIECVRKLKSQAPEINFVMLTVYDDNDDVFESLKAGASGYLLKRTSPHEILQAIEDVYNGGSPMSSQIARKIVQSFHRFEETPNETEKLSEREGEILSLLSKGYKYNEIADSLFISVHTVRSHLRSIYEKLHVRSRTEAVVKFLNK